MYHKLLAECFPREELPLLYQCVNKPCFYYDTLMVVSETSYRTEWCPLAEDVLDFPACPSCNSLLEEYTEDGTFPTYV